MVKKSRWCNKCQHISISNSHLYVYIPRVYSTYCCDLVVIMFQGLTVESIWISCSLCVSTKHAVGTISCGVLSDVMSIPRDNNSRNHKQVTKLIRMSRFYFHNYCRTALNGVMKLLKAVKQQYYAIRNCSSIHLVQKLYKAENALVSKSVGAWFTVCNKNPLYL